MIQLFSLFFLFIYSISSFGFEYKSGVVKYSPKGKLIYVATTGFPSWLYDSVQGTQVSMIGNDDSLSTYMPVEAVFSTDERKIAIIAFDINKNLNRVLVYDTISESLVFEVPSVSMTSLITSISFGINEDKLYLTYLDGSIFIWDLNQKAVLNINQRKIKTPIFSAEFDLSHQTIIFADGKNHIQEYSLAKKAMVESFDSGYKTLQFTKIAVSENQKWIAAISKTNQKVYFWNKENLKSIYRISAPKESIKTVNIKFNKQSNILAIAFQMASKDVLEQVALYDLDSKNLIQTIDESTSSSSLTDFDFSPDGNQITLLNDGYSTWDVKSGKLILRINQTQD